MKRYTIEIEMSNGDSVQAKAIGENALVALANLGLAIGKLIEEGNEKMENFFREADISDIKFIGVERIEKNPHNIILQRLPASDMYMAYEKDGVSIIFQAGKYNETAKVIPQPNAHKSNPIEISTSIRRVGEWLMENHRELL